MAHRLSLLCSLLMLVVACDGVELKVGESSTSSTSSSTSTIARSTTARTPTTTPYSTTTTPAVPEFPPEADSLEHGGDAWVVVLAASEDFDDPTLDKAVADAKAAGYRTGVTDCDFGAAEALGLAEEAHYYTVSVYLNNQEDALRAEAAFEARGVSGTAALVQTYCMD